MKSTTTLTNPSFPNALDNKPQTSVNTFVSDDKRVEVIIKLTAYTPKERAELDRVWLESPIAYGMEKI